MPARAQDKPDDADRAREKYCKSLSEADRLKLEICSTQEERDAAEARKRQEAIAEHEKPTHSRFPKWLHIDSMWMPGNFQEHTYGVIGLHITVANLDRVYFYGPPGFMLLVEDNGFSHRVRPALTWGVSLFLVNFRIPTTNHSARLFLNVSKYWTTTGLDAETSYVNGRDLAGLSFTWNR
jgi:hypothetical protein